MRTLKPALAAIVLGAIAFLASKSLAQDATNAPPPPPQVENGGDDVIAETPDDTGEDAAYFQDQLSTYGQWINTPDYGLVFQPTNLQPDWRPYTLGHWVYTDDDGWLWVSDEPFGWATDHYGRWYSDPTNGWVWVPGRTWAPAWVAWRSGNGEVGWAPLPPARRGVAFDVNAAISGIAPTAFSFVDERDLTDEHVHDRIHSVRDNATIIKKTTNITKIQNVQGHVVNRSVDVNEVEKAAGKKIPHLKVAESKDRGSGKVNGDQVAVFRPTLPARKNPTPEARKAADQQTPQHVEQSQHPQPLTEQPKVEEHKPDEAAPKVEEPRVEPKAEEPKVEEHKAESPPPSAEAPKAEDHKAADDGAHHDGDGKTDGKTDGHTDGKNDDKGQ